jgi:N-ethylmaleimide reductase
VAPSAIRAEGHAYSDKGEVEFTTPRALELQEIPSIIAEFRRGAERALEAGFDGVEIHGANGYLPDQFLQDGSNIRADEYGGSIENRARFLLEVTEAVASVWRGDRVGVRIAPSGTYGSMHDSDPERTFGYVAEPMNRFGLAYLHIIAPRIKGIELIRPGQEPLAAQHLRAQFTARSSRPADLPDTRPKPFSRRAMQIWWLSISNPDLPHRFRIGVPLSSYERSTFYGGDERGYTDYASLGESAAPASASD